MLRVLYASSNLGPGRKERQFYETITNQDKSIVSPIVVVFQSSTFYSDRLATKFTILRTFQREIQDPSLFRSMGNIKTNKPDIIHAWDSLSMLYTFLPCRYYKAFLIDGSIRDSGVDKGFWFYFKRFFLKRADLVIANSYAGLKAYSCKGYVVYNGIKLKKNITGVSYNGFNIIMTANFSDYKDHRTFLQAGIVLLRNGIINNAFLIGDGPNKEKYKDWIYNDYPDLKQKIHFSGTVKDVDNYLAMCSVGILCSTVKFGEGISNAVLEYMAAGLVPIVTDIGGSSEIIENGINGFLSAPVMIRK